MANKKLSPIEEAKLKKIMADPVLWAQAFLITNDAAAKKYGPWKARDYQIEMLHDKSVRKVYRLGRRCLPGWSKILDPTTGELKTMEELFNNQKGTVVSLSDSYGLEQRDNIAIWNSGEREVFRVTLKSGKKIDATENHPLLTVNDWKNVSDLRVGDSIAVPAALPFFGDELISDDAFESMLSGREDRVPAAVFKAPAEQIAAYLFHLFALDGRIGLNNDSVTNIEYYAGNEEKRREISHLLLRFGIKSTMNREMSIAITDIDSITVFFSKIGVISDTPLDIVKHLKKTDEKGRSNAIDWEEIISIESIGKHTTYDMSVPKTHNFVADDIFTHNCGKTETMVVDGLHKACTNKQFRILYITPYENQVNLIFTRMRELIGDSPLVKMQVVGMKNSPYQITFANGSIIMGFTTGASSGQGAASVRGQRADWLFLDELDYMAELDYSTVSAIAGERADIGMTCSSTPTGKRGTFWRMCTDPTMNYSEHFHPSIHNPNWCKEMEDRFRAEFSPAQYEHEILAEFGTEETGVFDKDKLDLAMRQEFYAYDKLDSIQERNLEDSMHPSMLLYDENNHAPYNAFRCIGIDWDKYQAGSSIVVLDFDTIRQKFKVIKRIEVPRSEYSLLSAIDMTIKVNEIYNPTWIFVDRGYGDVQLERLHQYGEEHPSSGLKTKVVGWQFKNTVDVIDPVTKERHKEPMKQFMVNQLTLTFEKQRMILSPFDEKLHKQLIDYSVDHISQSGLPIYTSKEEHFVDALGLAHLAFVLNFPQIAQSIKQPEFTSKIESVHGYIGDKAVDKAFMEVASPINAWGQDKSGNPYEKRAGWESDTKYSGVSHKDSQQYEYWKKEPVRATKHVSSSRGWGGRSSGFSGRSLW